jgi:hypothetical protein
LYHPHVCLQLGLSTISALKAMGCPEALFCVDEALALATAASGAGARAGGDDTYMDGGEEEDDAVSVAYTVNGSRKKGGGSAMHAIRKANHNFIINNAMLPEAKIVDVNSNTVSEGAAAAVPSGHDTSMLIRTLRNMRGKPVSWRAQRSYLLADKSTVRVTPQEQDSGSGSGSGPRYRVELGGYLRGRPMQVHSLVHLVGVGAGRVARVWQGAPPHARNAASEHMGEIVADKSRCAIVQL